MRKGLKYILMLLSVIIMGCTKENTEDCFTQVNLRFHFTLHEEPKKGNLFGQNIKSIKAYIFNESGILHSINTENRDITNNFLMPLELDPGHYSIIVWACDNPNFSNTHNILHATNISQTPPTFKELEIGKSKIDDIYAFLECNDLKPKIDKFDDFYFGAVGTRSTDGKSQYSIIPIHVKTGEVAEHDVELIRNTNIIQITVEGLENLTVDSIDPKNRIDIWAKGGNTLYTYNNTLNPIDIINYLPYESISNIESTTTCTYSIKTERLEWLKNEQIGKEQVQLHVATRDGKILYDGSLLSLLAEAKDEKGNHIYKNQEDLDRIYTHPIKFVIEKRPTNHDLYVKIFVHNWEVVTLIPEI